MTSRDVRVCALGDSYVAGVGDPQHLGWVRRLAARTHTGGLPLTVYDLGVRMNTLADVAARWRTECDPRLPPGCEGRVLVAGGVNDTTAAGDGVRVAPDDAVRHLRAVTTVARERGWQVLVVGPAAVDDDAHNARAARLDTVLAAACLDDGVPYVSVHGALAADPTWRREVRDGDGAHPSSGGYAVLAALVEPAWTAWLDSPAGR
jgi:lysophospholipase L1-like esterase